MTGPTLIPVPYLTARSPYHYTTDNALAEALETNQGAIISYIQEYLGNTLLGTINGSVSATPLSVSLIDYASKGGVVKIKGFATDTLVGGSSMSSLYVEKIVFFYCDVSGNVNILSQSTETSVNTGSTISALTVSSNGYNLVLNFSNFSGTSSFAKIECQVITA